MAIEHQGLAVAVAFPAGDHVGTSFFDFLPGDLEAHAFPERAHVVSHPALMPRRAGNIDDVTAHGDERLLVDLSKDLFRHWRNPADGRLTDCFQDKAS